MDNKTASYHQQHNEGTIKLTGVVDIFEAAAVHPVMQQALADKSAETLILDLSKAERFDLSAIQMLLALQRDAEAEGRTFRISDPSPRITDGLARIGISFPSTQSE